MNSRKRNRYSESSPSANDSQQDDTQQVVKRVQTRLGIASQFKELEEENEKNDQQHENNQQVDMTDAGFDATKRTRNTTMSPSDDGSNSRSLLDKQHHLRFSIKPGHSSHNSVPNLAQLINDQSRTSASFSHHKNNSSNNLNNNALLSPAKKSLSSASLKNSTSSNSIVLDGLNVASFASPSGARSIGPIVQNAETFHALKEAPEIEEFSRVAIQYGPFIDSPEYNHIVDKLYKALQLRKKFTWLCEKKRDETEFDLTDDPQFVKPDPTKIPNDDHNKQFSIQNHKGVYFVYETSQPSSDNPTNKQPQQQQESKLRWSCPSRDEYSSAMYLLVSDIASDPATRSFCYKRLHLLEMRFNLHELLNHDLESIATKSVPHRDFYNVRKIDGHVHAAAAFNQKHLLRFIKHKLKSEGDKPVIVRNGEVLTLKQVFESLNLTPYDLSVDTLDMHATNTFHRFDRFNSKYNPVGESRLREIFLKHNNYVQGRYFAELMKQVFDDLESNRYYFAEYRISIYGRSRNEWAILAKWIWDNQLFHYNVRWLVQIPRLYASWKQTGAIQNFQEFLDNIFLPLFEATLYPNKNAETRQIHLFLQQCVGFDLVDDESKREKLYKPSLPIPQDWNNLEDPCYAWFTYYIYANMATLNQLRSYLGFTTFSLRPHAGESGDIEHLATTFLLAHGINHGLTLYKNPAMQYLYYLSQIGISMSPLSNNLLFLEYEKNPFPRFAQRGLNVALSTDDPLMIHVTRESLAEEYACCSQVWKFTSIDMCEFARNSVLQSGFEHRFKAHFLGNKYWIRGVEGNDTKQTNVPKMRVQFRAELLQEEMQLLSQYSENEFLIEQLVDPL